MGIDSTQNLITASSMCGACEEVCPVRIPIPSLLQRLRQESKHNAEPNHDPLNGQNAAHNTLEIAAMKGFVFAATHPTFYHAGLNAARKMNGILPEHLGNWTQCRVKPKLAKTSLKAKLAKRQGGK